MANQWAVELARAGLHVWLCRPRESRAEAAALLLPYEGKLPLHDLRDSPSAISEPARRSRVRIAALPLGLFPGRRAMRYDDVVGAGAEQSDVLVLDDSELTGWSPAELRTVADLGMLVLAVATIDPSIPVHAPSAPLTQHSDHVVVVTTQGPSLAGELLPDGEGEIALIALVRNRQGSSCENKVYFEPFYARFRRSIT